MKEPGDGLNQQSFLPDIEAHVREVELDQLLVDKLKANVQVRKAVEGLIEMIELEAESFSPDQGYAPAYKMEFWRQLSEFIDSHHPLKNPLVKVVSVKPMGPSEYNAFNNKRIDYGIHEGTKYKDVPLDYLLAIDEKSKKLSRYLASREVQMEQNEPE